METNTFVWETAWNFTKQLKWLDKYLEHHSGFIAGGFAKNIFEGKPVRDLDIFFHTRGAFDSAVEVFTNSKWEGVTINELYENDNVKALVYSEYDKKMVLEFNRKLFGSPEYVLSKFDFTVAKFAYTRTENWDAEYPDRLDPKQPWRYNACYHRDFFKHFTLKRLVVDDTLPFPADTFHRMFKYAKYGYYPCRETKIKVMKEIRELNDDTIENISSYLMDGWD